MVVSGCRDLGLTAGTSLMRKHRVAGGLLAVVGYILSPLSWWNDVVVNIPIACGFGFLFGLISESLFLPFMVLGYWLTNIIGLVLLHKGITTAVRRQPRPYRRRDLLKDLAVSVVYTLVIAALAWSGVVKLPMEYFPSR